MTIVGVMVRMVFVKQWEIVNHFKNMQLIVLILKLFRALVLKAAVGYFWCHADHS